MSNFPIQICRANLYSRSDAPVDLNADGFEDRIHFQPGKNAIQIQFGKRDGYFPRLSKIDANNLGSLKGLRFFGVPVETLFSQQNKIPATSLFGPNSTLKGLDLEIAPLRAMTFHLLAKNKFCEVGMKLWGPWSLWGLSVTLNAKPLRGPRPPTARFGDLKPVHPLPADKNQKTKEALYSRN